MIYKSYASAVVLGFPIKDRENPYIALPIERVRLDVDLEVCKKPFISAPSLQSPVYERLSHYWEELSRGLKEEYCASLDLLDSYRGPPSGLYAISSSILLYALGKESGETLEVDDIIELSELADGIRDPSWRGVMSAMRCSSLNGRPCVYRRRDEKTVFSDFSLPLTYKGSVSLREVLDKDYVGENVYGAITRLIGLSVLEASIRLAEGNDFLGVFSQYRRITDSVSYALYNIFPKGKCFYVPGFPYEAEALCEEDKNNE